MIGLTRILLDTAFGMFFYLSFEVLLLEAYGKSPHGLVLYIE